MSLSRIAGAKLIWLGVALSAAYWLFDSSIHYLVYKEVPFEFVPSDRNELWMRTVTSVLLVLFGVYSHVMLSRLAMAQEELRQAHVRLRAAASEAVLAEERERRRLAVDLHDGLGQLLVLANIKLGLLREEVQVEMLDPRLREIESLIVEAREQSRALTSQLCPPVLYELGFVAAARWLATNMERRYGLRVAVEEKGDCEVSDETTRISLFRSVNELLLNVARHAKTSKALVRVSNWGRDITITVEDQGVGFDPSSITSEYGLFSVRERLHHLGGILTIASKRGEGTRISLIAPLSAATSSEH
jgi:signal transduction histidine kinase